MFPLLSPEEEAANYAEDRTVRFGGAAAGSDFEAMRAKFREWTKQHADMYYPLLQKHRRVLELASGYEFFAERLMQKSDDPLCMFGGFWRGRPPQSGFRLAG